MKAQDLRSSIEELEKKGIYYFYHHDLDLMLETYKVSDLQPLYDKLIAFNTIFDSLNEKYKLPEFVKFIATSNTNLDINFVASDGASGIWPLSFAIAKKYELIQNDYYDERRSVVLSTKAAMQYIQELYLIYKDWYKVTLAFKIGAIRLNQVLRSCKTELKMDSIYNCLNADEKKIILKFVCDAVVFSHPEKYNLRKSIRVAPLVSGVWVSTKVQVEFGVIEKFTSITKQELQQLNPELKQSTVPFFGKPFYFRVPNSKLNLYTSKSDSIVNYVLEQKKPLIVTDTIITIIDSVENITYRTREVERGSGESGRRIINEVNTSVPNVSSLSTAAYAWVYYTIKSGDGLYTLADIFDCTIQQIKAWNAMSNNNLIVGRQLKMYVPTKRIAYYQSLNTMNLAQKQRIAKQD